MSVVGDPLRPCCQEGAQLVRRPLPVYPHMRTVVTEEHGVDVVREYDRSIPRICARGSELNQVWTNLIDNAIDAMNGRGELVVRTAAEFSGILVEIRDSGPGIPQEIRALLFTPFFSTKRNGRGLGLTLVQEILTAHGFEFSLGAGKGGGAEFRGGF